jgi:hypothetical protein
MADQALASAKTNGFNAHVGGVSRPAMANAVIPASLITVCMR